mmetsp:Transcript_1981/g.3753  ORF Transcript_1981/g.3753 Transcript_1981/m.3753 type:complete len:564 (-) Transcript_1981:943-2634(-)
MICCSIRTKGEVRADSNGGSPPMANKAEKKARVKEQQRHAKVLWNWILGFKVKKLEKEFERIGCAIFEVDLCPPRQRTCLHIAALEGFEIGVRRFIDWKAEVDARDIDGHTPLFEALKSCHLNTAKILIDNRASINARDKQNNTPLLASAARNFDQVECVRFLIKARANIFEGLRAGMLEEAKRRSNKNIVEFLQHVIDGRELLQDHDSDNESSSQRRPHRHRRGNTGGRTLEDIVQPPAMTLPLQVGDLVWAKTRDWPWWPSCVLYTSILMIKLLGTDEEVYVEKDDTAEWKGVTHHVAFSQNVVVQHSGVMDIAVNYRYSPGMTFNPAYQLPRKRLVERKRPRMPSDTLRHKKQQATPSKQHGRAAMLSKNILRKGCRKRMLNADAEHSSSRARKSQHESDQPTQWSSDEAKSSNSQPRPPGSTTRLGTNPSHEKPTRVIQKIGKDAFVYDLFPLTPGTKNVTLRTCHFENGKIQDILSVERRPLGLDDLRDLLVCNNELPENTRLVQASPSDQSIQADQEQDKGMIGVDEHVLSRPTGNIVGVKLVIGKKAFGAKWSLRA